MPENYRRDKTRVVSYRVPQNHVVQLYDYKKNESRIVFGPGLVLLKPDEQFTMVTLSGGTPKREGQIKAVAMSLGPDFMTDIVQVETADHAKLSLELSYNWNFEFDQSNVEDHKKLFQVKDFIGNCCKNIASRVRGAVSGVSFDNFHTNSKDIIRTAVFGKDKKTNEVREQLHFDTNNLRITSVDVKSSQPVDKEVRASLDKSISLSMDITTKKQEAKAIHKAKISEQENKGRLQRQELEDLCKAEETKKNLLLLQAETLKIKVAGESKANANAKAEESRILGKEKVFT